MRLVDRTRYPALIMTTPAQNPLGKSVAYASTYDAQLLFPMPRATHRAALGIDVAALPFHGVDIWNAYELSWLDARGKPEIALAQFRIPAASPNMIESKSLKLYLNGFNHERLRETGELRARLVRDLSAAAGAAVAVTLTPAHEFTQLELGELAGESIDALAVEITDYSPPNPGHLRLASNASAVEERLTSNLLKSNCPVTGQPDWASIQIHYCGPRIDREGLLRYLVSFREHAEFHEHCVERIFIDLTHACKPAALSVYARYTRRGGLDINPWRSSHPDAPTNPRGARQ